MKKRQKSKMTMLIAGGLAAVSLVSVGFASWVINDITEANTQVTINVGTVSNNTLKAEVLTEQDGKDLTLRFDNVAAPNGQFLGNTDGLTEDLTFKIPVKITGNLTVLNTIDFTCSGSLASAALYGPGDIEYLTAPWLGNEKKAVYNYSGKAFNTLKEDRASAGDPIIVGNTVTILFTFNFKWGPSFHNENPGNVTNDEIANSTLLDRLNDFAGKIQANNTLNQPI